MGSMPLIIQHTPLLLFSHRSPRLSLIITLPLFNHGFITLPHIRITINPFLKMSYLLNLNSHSIDLTKVQV
jgi:hypothetical protein